MDIFKTIYLSRKEDVEACMDMRGARELMPAMKAEVSNATSIDIISAYYSKEFICELFKSKLKRYCKNTSIRIAISPVSGVDLLHLMVIGTLK